jgi:hypothetical protein
MIPGQSGYYNEPHGNWAALFINVNTDIMSDQWGMPPLYWQTDVGSVLIIRQDEGLDLSTREDYGPARSIPPSDEIGGTSSPRSRWS